MKITIKCLVHQSVHGESFNVFMTDMSEYGFVVVGEAELEYDVPDDFNPTAAKIATLEKKLGVMSDEYQRNVAAIRGQISDLQCIEHTPVGEA